MADTTTLHQRLTELLKDESDGDVLHALELLVSDRAMAVEERIASIEDENCDEAAEKASKLSDLAVDLADIADELGAASTIADELEA